MSAHTPGPWTVGQAYRHGYSPGFCPIIGGNAQVALVDACDRHMPWPNNAHLIAAAPDMLAALKRILPYVMQQTSADEPGPEYEHYHASKAVRAAIARAEGHP